MSSKKKDAKMLKRLEKVRKRIQSDNPETKGQQLRDALRNQNDQIKIQQLLASDDAYMINDSDGYGNTALMIAADTAQDDIIEELLKRGAKIHAKDTLGQTALMYAAFNSHYHTVKLLVEKKAGVNVQTGDGQTALMKACYTRLPSTPLVVQLLVERGKAKLDLARKDGRTAIMIATESGSRDVVLFLAVKGANINAVSSNGDTATHIAAKRGHFTVLRDFARLGSESTKEVLGLKRFHSSLEATMDPKDVIKEVALAVKLGLEDRQKDQKEGTSVAFDAEVFSQSKTKEATEESKEHWNP